MKTLTIYKVQIKCPVYGTFIAETFKSRYLAEMFVARTKRMIGHGKPREFKIIEQELEL